MDMKHAGAVVSSLVLLLSPSLLRADDVKIDSSKLPASAAGTMDFQRDIKPILAKACISCHGPEKQRAGLRLDERKAALQGSNAGPVLRPGKAAESRLLHVVAGLDPDVQMPPKGKQPLTTAEIGKLRAWIDQGAPWTQETAQATTPKSDHWSFQPIQRPMIPVVAKMGWVRNEVDRFVLARLEKEKIEPSPEADRTTLIRRLSLDLLGLPPSPEEVAQFVGDQTPDAYEKLVDRLLSSPHYGERWGRHWLDLARYADSDGYEQDRPRPFAWRYRQWVIDALNGNMPFDQFTIEQLAGDLLPNATISQKTATGFHRNTLTNREGGTDKEQFRVEACVDRVSTTAKVFLGLTMNCSQCHDHKYDPLSQREFYQLFAFFNSDNEVDLPAPLPGEEENQKKAKAVFEQKKAELKAAVDRYKKEELPAGTAQWEKGLTAEQHKKLPANIQAILNVTANQRTAPQKQQLADYYGKTDKKLVQLTKAMADHEKKAAAPSVVPTLALGNGRKTHVLLRGDFLRPGVEVQPGTPAVLHPFPSGPAASLRASRVKGEKKATRLDLAHWLVDPANPLTARVIANWIWHKYFGRGLVATLEDFGTQGEKPSHPELLDYLATELVRHKWSLKAFHKAIVTSATYRQVSRSRPELAGRDPANVLLARQNRLRLEAEVIRDNALAVSGLLNRATGGPSVKPPQPAGVSELTYANTARWVESKGADRYRRGMYTWFQRTSPYPMLMTFDAPDGVLSCVRREKSNTPLQALTLLNDTAFVECAQGLARRVLTEKAGSAGDRLAYAFQLCVARRPNMRELAALNQLYNDLRELAGSDAKEAGRLLGATSPPVGVEPAEAAAWIAVARTLLNLDEFVTRE
jgi:mono/diheme cytochrome c family protein